MILFSILIPFYNSEQYLARCLNSVLRQSYSNYEIILLNDGSNDNSREIAYEYKKESSKIRYYENSTNKGVAASRNKLVKLVKGDYFIFIDSDDYINQDLLLNLNEFLCKNKVDILRFQGVFYGKNGEIIPKYVCDYFDIGTGKEVLKFFIKNHFKTGMLWLYCYNNSFYKKNYFTFLENKIHEDFYNIYILLKAQSIGYIDYIGYNYIKNNCGITSIKTPEQEYQRLLDILYVYDYVVDNIYRYLQNNEKDFIYIVGNFSDFLDVGLKYVNTNTKDFYLQQVKKRKKYFERRSYNE